MRDNYDVYDVVYYLLWRLGGKVKGVKKLMKSVFLIQYERHGEGIVKYLHRGKPVACASFYIWNYGPLSNEVYQVIDELPGDDEEYPVVLRLPENVDLKALTRKLPEPVKKRIDDVVERYGHYHGFELERLVNDMLGLDPYVKDEYRGVDVDKYLHDVGLGPFKIQLQ